MRHKEKIRIDGIDFDCKYPVHGIEDGEDVLIIAFHGQYLPKHTHINILYREQVYHGKTVLKHYFEHGKVTKLLVFLEL